MAMQGESAWQGKQAEPLKGTLPSALSCVFGVMGIFFAAIIFVPLATLCALVGFVRGCSSRNSTAIGLSLLGFVLCLFDFATSPSLWLLFGLGALTALVASHHSTVPTDQGVANNWHPDGYLPTIQTPSAQGNSLSAPSFDISQAGNLILRLQRYENAADDYLSHMDAVKSHYHAITDKMDRYLERERHLAGDPNMSVQRGQLSVAISQGVVAADQYHIQIQQEVSAFDDRVAPLKRDVAAFQSQCQNLPISSGDPPAWRNACRSFLVAVKEAQDKAKKLEEGIAGLEDAYAQEHQMQDEIVSRSQQIE